MTSLSAVDFLLYLILAQRTFPFKQDPFINTCFWWIRLRTLLHDAENNVDVV